MNAKQNYPLLKGMKANLYKCFMPVGWMLAGQRGVVGYLHPESPYDDPEGGVLREAVYARLRAHFQFKTNCKLFPRLDHHTKYGINIYGAPEQQPALTTSPIYLLPRLLMPVMPTMAAAQWVVSRTNRANGTPLATPTASSDIGDAELTVFAQLYDEPGTPPRRARLPALHAESNCPVYWQNLPPTHVVWPTWARTIFPQECLMKLMRTVTAR